MRSGQPFLGRREPQGQVDAQRRQHRERPGRVDGQRRQHRQHVVTEVRRERVPADVVEVGRGDDPNPVRRERRQEIGGDQAVQAGDQGVDAGRHLAELLGGREAGRVGLGVALLDRVLQPRHAHHEELVEVRRHDRRELRALEQRVRLVGGLFRHPLVEGEPGELAVEEELRRALALRAGPRRRGARPAAVHDWTPAPRHESDRPNTSWKRSARASTFMRSIARSPMPCDLEQPAAVGRPSRAGPAPSGCARRRGRWRCAAARPACSRGRARCGRGPCTAGATAAAGRAGGSGRRWR